MGIGLLHTSSVIHCGLAETLRDSRLTEGSHVPSHSPVAMVGIWDFPMFCGVDWGLAVSLNECSKMRFVSCKLCMGAFTQDPPSTPV